MTEQQQPSAGIVVGDVVGGNAEVFRTGEGDGFITMHLVCSDCGAEEDVPLPAGIAAELRAELERLNADTLPGLRCPDCARENHMRQMFGGLLDMLTSPEGLPFDDVPAEGLVISPDFFDDPFLESDGEPPF